jgi:hypothetical protein
MSHGRVTMNALRIAAFFGVMPLIGCGPTNDVDRLVIPPPTQPAAATNQLAGTGPQDRETWHSIMAKTPVPKKGCFHVALPDTSWTEVPCLPPRNVPLLPRKKGNGADTVGGGGGDFTATVFSGTISFAKGQFPSMTGVDFNTDSLPYSLQLNSNVFNTPVCGGGCQGWQQFVYENDFPSIPSSASLYMQYWLINYGPGCPSGWMTFGNDCWKNSSITGATNMQLSLLGGHIQLEGNIAGGIDTVLFYDGVSNMWVTGNDSVLSLASGWTSAEFNVFGDGGGSQITFNSGVTAVVQTSVDNGVAGSPGCQNSSTTAETNNLNLVPASCCPNYDPLTPFITFTESNVSGVVAPFCLEGDLAAFATPLL